MKRLVNMLFLGFLFTWGIPGIGVALSQNIKDDFRQASLENIKELNIRGGLPNFFTKVEQARQLHIGYLGGSITEAGDGWRELTYNWFRVHYPQIVITQTNGGIGGTGSGLGAFRVESDIMQHSPDLVFVEFAVNDGGQLREDILKMMEGIVRKIRKSSPFTDICFVYTTDQTKCEELIKGTVAAAVVAMEAVAEHYQIPSIYLGVEVAKLQKAGKLLFTADPSENEHKIVFTKDGVHPLPASGHPIYASVVTRNMEKMEKVNRIPGVHSLPQPLNNNNWEESEKINLAELHTIGIWELLPDSHQLMQMFSRFTPQIYKALPGSKLTFSFVGTTLGIYDVVGPMSGKIKVTIDGRVKEFTRFDRYCFYNRLGYSILADNLEHKQHAVELEVLGNQLDKENMLLDEKRSSYQENRALYDKVECYVGNILVVGKICKE